MLTELELSLITAAVDGPLPADQAAALRAILAEKPEAAKLFRKLKADSAAIKNLPKARAPKSLATNVMAQVRKLPKPAPVVPAKAPRKLRKAKRVPTWIPLGIAASVLFAVTATSFAYFNNTEQTARVKADADLGVHLPAPRVSVEGQPPRPEDYASAVPTITKPQPIKRDPDDVLPLPREVPHYALNKPSELAPFPRPAGGEVVGHGIIEFAKPLVEVELRLPFTVSVADFDKPDAKERLAQEFALDPAFRLDLFSKNLQTGSDQFIAALKSAGITPLVDAATHERLTKKVPITLAFYVEGLNAKELTELLSTLAKNVQKGSGPGLERANLVPAAAPEHKDLKELFGVDLGIQRTPRAAAPASPGTQAKPIGSDTIGQITNNLKKGAEKQAIELTYLPPNLRTAPQSKEVKTFLERRGDRKPGTIPLLVVIRQTAN